MPLIVQAVIEKAKLELHLNANWVETQIAALAVWCQTLIKLGLSTLGRACMSAVRLALRFIKKIK
jgi:hypothetical protein